MRAKSASEFRGIVTVPDGSYPGKWGGYVVRFDVDGKEITFSTDVGVRGMSIPVTVVVKDNKAEVEQGIS